MAGTVGDWVTGCDGDDDDEDGGVLPFAGRSAKKEKERTKETRKKITKFKKKIIRITKTKQKWLKGRRQCNTLRRTNWKRNWWRRDWLEVDEKKKEGGKMRMSFLKPPHNKKIPSPSLNKKIEFTSSFNLAHRGVWRSQRSSRGGVRWGRLGSD